MQTLHAHGHYDPSHTEPTDGARFIYRTVAVETNDYADFVLTAQLDKEERKRIVRIVLRMHHIEYERAPYEDGRVWNSEVVTERTEDYVVFRQRAFSWN